MRTFQRLVAMCAVSRVVPTLKVLDHGEDLRQARTVVQKRIFHQSVCLRRQGQGLFELELPARDSYRQIR